MTTETRRRLPVGAELVDDGTGVSFRVWAPKRRRVEVVLDDAAIELERESDPGYFAGTAEGALAGARYKFRLDGKDSFPDPASRSQPDGPHGASQVVDPTRFAWTDRAWRGVGLRNQVIYEIHIGTFTREGTYAAAAEQLRSLVDLGITLLEVMPVAEFPGRFGWGYDGVNLFAPYHVYGTPDDFRAFVDRAHREGLGVVLDVVYNHYGPDGNYLSQFSDSYFTKKHRTDWGAAINYDGADSKPVREMVLANVVHWIEEYHLDGLRLDATDNIYDDSEPHLLREIADTARRSAGARGIVLLAENEAQRSRLIRPVAEGGYGLDLAWNDDFHHTAIVAATGRREAYFTDYGGTPQELLSAVKRGYLYQGQRYQWQRQRRGSSTRGLEPFKFTHFLENHDQVANSADGRRLHQLTSPGRYRALTALLLLSPQTPLLFQGQEFASSAPFLYFADHNPELATLVRAGRKEFLSQFPSLADERSQEELADPGAMETVERCRLDFTERERHGAEYALHRDLIALRRSDATLSSCSALDGAVLADSALVLRFFAENGDDRLLVLNLGADHALEIVPEPLLAAPEGTGWRELWSSEDLSYGGRGAPPIESEDGSWRLPAESATLLAPRT